MSIPIILGSLFLSVLDAAQAGAMAQIDWFSIFIGAAAGYFAVRVMLKLIAKANFKWFSLYLVVVAVGCFFGYFL